MSNDFTWYERLGLWSGRSWKRDESGAAGSQAEDRARLLAINRLERARQRVEAADADHTRLKQWATTNLENIEREGDVGEKVLSYTLEERVLAKRDRSSEVRDPRRLLVRVTDEDTVVASCTPFDDGSGLILFSEGLMGLVDLFSKQFALSSGVRPGPLGLLDDRALAMAATTSHREDEYSRAVDVALLRWRLFHQRVYGNSASLFRTLPRPLQRVADNINGHAMTFVVAHECAHHLLGHSAVTRGFSTSAELQPCLDDLVTEESADERALELLTRRGSFGAEESLGALVAIMAVEYFESTAFVRQAATHPRPHDRARRVLERTSSWNRAALGHLVARVRVVADRAADRNAFVEPSWWKTMYEAPDVLTEPHSLATINRFFETDKIVSAPLDNVDRLLDHVASVGLDVRREADLVRSGSLEDGLGRLGISDRQTRLITDPNITLSFAAVVRVLGQGLTARGADPTTVFVLRLVFARLVESRFREV
ncbi:hypothetical protein [Actinomycetospora flava]|uniref:IrrE N-terminal-like domain-containing protein n=1 Tax=Actinomycetospora flava TaxID=3129232 RepID=A0ABU8M686_9PSEU